jgi:hypothetical protein
MCSFNTSSTASDILWPLTLTLCYSVWTTLIYKTENIQSPSRRCNRVIKGQAILVPAWTGPGGSRRLRLRDFQIIGTWKVQGCPPCAPREEIFISVEGWARPEGLSQWHHWESNQRPFRLVAQCLNKLRHCLHLASAFGRCNYSMLFHLLIRKGRVAGVGKTSDIPQSRKYLFYKMYVSYSDA